VRVLPDPMEAAQNAVVRRPAYKVLAYIVSLLESISDIVAGTSTQEPLDITAYCTDIQWTPDKLDFTMSDPDGLFHPDTGLYKKHLGDGAVIRLQEGDSTVDESYWMNTFTGTIRGQIGWKKSRRQQTMISTVSVFSRENNQALKRRKVTSKSYTVGTELGVMLRDILTTFMGLTDAEIRVASVLGLQLKHKVNQISQMAPWDAVEKLLEAVGRIPCFDGDGKLTSIDKDMNRSPDRIFLTSTPIYDYEVPARNQDAINKVKVIFLDSELSRVDSPYQSLGTAQVTTGFFSMGEKLPVYWGEDKKQRASGTEMIVKKSVNSGLLPVGEESYEEVDEYHGVIKVSIDAWVPILATAMLMEYLAASFISDYSAPGQPVQVVPVEGTGATVAPWPNIPWGKVLQAQAMVSIMLIMMCMGSAQYEVWGVPYDYAYKEQQSVAIQQGLRYWEENETEITNDFLGSFTEADALAMKELTWEMSSACPRTLVIADDLALERGDIIQLPDGRKFLITDMSKTIKRGEIPQLSLEGFKVMTA
jgi:hypothetical protein